MERPQMKGKKQALYTGEGCVELFQGEGTSMNLLQWKWVRPTCKVTEDGKLAKEQRAPEGRSSRTTVEAYSCNLSVVETDRALPPASLSSKGAE